jgi:type IV pilus assembly protein PilE
MPRSPPRPRTPRQPTGFTLIEVLIVLSVAMLLASLAVPSYQAQAAKGRRLDGQQALRALAQRLERRYTELGSYQGASLGAGGVYPAVSDAGLYRLAITDLADHAFRITATPQGVQATDECATLVYNQLAEPSVGAAARRPASQCW